MNALTGERMSLQECLLNSEITIKSTRLPAFIDNLPGLNAFKIQYVYLSRSDGAP